jgi:hypothetical protein
MPALTLAAAGAIAALVGRLRNRTHQTIAAVVIALPALVTPAGAIGFKLASTRAPLHAAGLMSEEAYWHDSRHPEISSQQRAVDLVNRNVPASGKVLMLFDARGYRYRPHMLQDNGLTNWPFLARMVTPPGCIEGSGVTHVLASTGILEYYESRGLDPRLMLWDRFDEFAERCLTLVGEAGGARLYAVRGGS